MRLRCGTWLFVVFGCALPFGWAGCGGTKKASPADAGVSADGPLGTGGAASGGVSGSTGGAAGSSSDGAGGGSGGTTTAVTSGSGGASSGGAGGTGQGGVAGSGGVANTGGTGVPSTGGSGGPASGGGSGVDSGGAGGVSGRADCPATQPAYGSACAGPYGDSGFCTWGDSLRPECRTRGSCNSGAWIVAQPPAYCAGLAATCPSDLPAESSLCPDRSLQCLYGGATLCNCTPCTGPAALGSPTPYCQGQPTGTPVWDCATTNGLPAECPATIPNRGVACQVPSTVGCPFDNCGGLNVFCTGGVWTWTYPMVDCGRSWCPSKCAVCASPDTPIATPDGDRPIADLQVGDLVYTVEGDAILPAPILRVSRTPVANHHVVRVTSTDGRVLEVSPGHPTADGRTFADLRPGNRLDGATIASVQRVDYRYPYTYDILPMSRSGHYFAAGVLIGTTLK